MALKDKTRDRDKVSASRRAPRQTAQTASEHERSANHAAVLQQAAGTPPAALRPADILALQRTVGNRAVQRILGHQPHVTPPPSTPAGAVQRKTEEEEEETLQAKPQNGERKENRTGLPDGLKAGIENLSGFSLDDVKVHYNSPAPAQVQSLAYTHGTDIHVGPGEEEHLPHEAWHVVQQKQGRVKPTLQAKGAAINDDAELEREAEMMGKAAESVPNHLQGGPGKSKSESRSLSDKNTHIPQPPPLHTGVVQRYKVFVRDQDFRTIEIENSLEQLTDEDLRAIAESDKRVEYVEGENVIVRPEVGKIKIRIKKVEKKDEKSDEKGSVIREANRLLNVRKLMKKEVKNEFFDLKDIPDDQFHGKMNQINKIQEALRKMPQDLYEYVKLMPNVEFPDDTWLRLTYDKARGEEKGGTPVQVGKHELRHVTQKAGNRSIWFEWEDKKMVVYAFAEHTGGSGAGNLEYGRLSGTDGIPKSWSLKE